MIRLRKVGGKRGGHQSLTDEEIKKLKKEIPVKRYKDLTPDEKKEIRQTFLPGPRQDIPFHAIR